MGGECNTHGRDEKSKVVVGNGFEGADSFI
jgi:hypothetical protein